MSYGFEVLNEAGEVICDSEYLGYGLVQQGSVNLRYQTPTAVNFTQVITSQSPPIIAIKMKAWNKTYIKICSVIGSPGAWTGIWFLGARIDNTSPANSVWEYRVYANVASSESYGIRILSSNNQVTFDSGSKQLKFRQFLGGEGIYTVLSQLTTAQERVLITRDDNAMVPPNPWVAISLCNWQRMSTHSSNVSGKLRTYDMFIHTCFAWLDNRMLIIIELQSAVTPLNYSAIIPVHYQVILD